MRKRCSSCKRNKPATKEYFHSNKRKADGLNNECKKCRSTARAGSRRKRRNSARTPRVQNTPIFEPSGGSKIPVSNGVHEPQNGYAMNGKKPEKELSQTRFDDVADTPKNGSTAEQQLRELELRRKIRQEQRRSDIENKIGDMQFDADLELEERKAMKANRDPHVARHDVALSAFAYILLLMDAYFGGRGIDFIASWWDVMNYELFGISLRSVVSYLAALLVSQAVLHMWGMFTLEHQDKDRSLAGSRIVLSVFMLAFCLNSALNGTGQAVNAEAQIAERLRTTTNHKRSQADVERQINGIRWDRKISDADKAKRMQEIRNKAAAGELQIRDVLLKQSWTAQKVVKVVLVALVLPLLSLLAYTLKLQREYGKKRVQLWPTR